MTFRATTAFGVLVAIAAACVALRGAIAARRAPPAKSAIAIRPARVDERSLLEDLQRRASLANPGDREALLEHPDAIAIPVAQLAAGRVFVAESAGAIVGFAALEPRADGDAELDALFVEPTQWRLGVGQRLVDRCCDVARGTGARAIHVIGNPHAQAFYLACGFESAGTAATRFGIGLLMRRPL
jgi:N-acetylglutamate synthase-like GNAT family acetyltransferase